MMLVSAISLFVAFFLISWLAQQECSRSFGFDGRRDQPCPAFVRAAERPHIFFGSRH